MEVRREGRGGGGRESGREKERMRGRHGKQTKLTSVNE